MMRQRRPERILRLVRPPSTGPGILAISSKKATVFYAFREIPCDIGGRGFALHRLGLGDLYHVRLGRSDECSCECLGFLRHGLCKHIAALWALIERGAI